MAALGSFKLSWYIQQRGYSVLFEKYPYLLTSDVTEEEICFSQETPEILGADCTLEQKARYEKLYKLCRKNQVALTALELYILCYMESSTFQILKSLFGEMCYGLTIEIAARIAYVEEDYLDLYWEMDEAYDCLQQIIFMEKVQGSCFRYPFVVEDRLISYLSGQNYIDRALEGIGSYARSSDIFSSVCVMEKEIEKTCMQLNLSGKQKFQIVCISGKRESGRRFVARQIAARLGLELFLLPLTYLFEDGRVSTDKWKNVLRELILTDRCLLLYDEEERSEEALRKLLPFYKDLEAQCEVLERPLFCTTGSKVKLLPFLKHSVLGFEIPKYSMEQSICLWKEAMREYGLGEEELPIVELAGKMQLTAGQIRRVVRKASQEIDVSQRAKLIYRFCYQILDDGKYDNIKRISTSYTLDDIKIGETQKMTLKSICAQVTYRLKVLDEWKMREKYPYGRGITVLFYGLPGTGKTMGAHVLSSMLGLEIYKVDLSQIADKYIGETEKRLEQVFQRAENSNMILFFDEADALLGKRGEVKEGRDKYANAEVSFLLQRMEEYDGIVIMATNLASNMDKAFMRRFRFMVQFPMPNRDVRREIWASLLESESVPKGFIDLDYLASQFELSGANIKNIVWNALFRAAAAQQPLGMQHLVFSVCDEYRKLGKVWSDGDFGAYYYLLEELPKI